MWAQCALARGHRGCWKILRSEHKPLVESWTTEDFWKSGAHDFLLFSSFFDSLSPVMLFTVLVFDRGYEQPSVSIRANPPVYSVTFGIMRKG